MEYKAKYMEWSQEHLLGVPQLDGQHKELMGFYNDALDNRSDNKAEEKDYFDKIVDSFVNLISKHFAAEEQFLTGGNYDQYDKHKLDHTKLLEKIYFVKSEIQNNRWEMNLLILAITLKDWFMRHFNAYDLSAKEYFREENDTPEDSMQTDGAESYFAFQ